MMQSEQMTARHVLEGKDDDMTDEGIWSATVKRPLDMNSLNMPASTAWPTRTC